MPLVTVTLRKPKSADFKSAILSAIHRVLVAAGVPEKDRFQRVLELDDEDFRFDREYPDLSIRRTDDFVLIEILFSVGRSVKVKSRFFKTSSPVWQKRRGWMPRMSWSASRRPSGRTGRSVADGSSMFKAALRASHSAVWMGVIDSEPCPEREQGKTAGQGDGYLGSVHP